jgi:protein SCO1/2
MAFAIFQPIQVLPRISVAPAFSFVDQDGSVLTSEDTRGALTIYTFAHSGCTAPCVSTTETLATLQPALAKVDLEGIPLRFVTMYVDPEEATPAKLSAFATEMNTEMNADPAQWRFVTGDPAQLKNVIGAGFRTYYDQDDEGNTIVDPVFVLVDGWGIVRATYRTSAPDPNLLTRDLRLIVQEARNSTGVSRYAYEAAHLFMCYPK